jgi:hypothetical protein
LGARVVNQSQEAVVTRIDDVVVCVYLRMGDLDLFFRDAESFGRVSIYYIYVPSLADRRTETAPQTYLTPT